MDDRTHRAKAEAPDDVLLRDDGTGLREDGVMPPAVKARPGSRLRPILLLSIAILLGLGIYRITGTFRAPKDTSRRGQETAPQPVGVATIGTGDINVVVTALGTVTPIATVTVKTQVNGQLLEVGFKEGQSVKKGDFLAQIDPRPFHLSEVQFEGQLIRDQGLLDQARKNLVRFQMLVKQDSIARQQADDQAFLVKQDEGLVKIDQALIDAQRLNLNYARIVSPIDGRVGLRLIDAGNYVQTTDPGLVVVAQMHPITVIFVVPEDDIPSIEAAIRAGMALEVTAYDRANVTPLSVGKVEALDSQIDSTTGTVKLRANFDNLDDKLFPNQFVNARLLVKSLRGAVTVPSSAVQHGAPGTYVYVLGADDNTVSARSVDLGPLDGAMFAVNAGLSPGDRVVVDGADRLRDGAKVLVSAGDGSNGGGTARPSDAVPPGKKPLQSQHRSEQGGHSGGPP